MKIRCQHCVHGTVLVVTVIVCGLVGVVLAAYLAMISSHNTFTHRSEVWNECIPLCEAGVEEAFAHLNYSGTTSNFAINGWTFASGAYLKNRTLNDGYCEMVISSDNPPVITVNGFLRTPLQSGHLTRSVRVQTKINQRFPNALLAKGAINLSGNVARVDSFNSTNALESTFGQYDPLKATDRASVATVSRDPGNLSIGNVDIYGRAGTGPGGNITIDANGNVGSALWNLDPLYDGQVQPGYYSDDVNIYIPDAVLPSDFASVFMPVSGTVNGTNYDYVLGDGDYRISQINMSANQKMIVTGKARLHVEGQTATSGQALILIANGGSIEWYAGDSVSLAGGGVVNGTGFAKNFSVIGLNTCGSIYYAGNSAFIGTIYAPHALVTMTGTSDASAAVIADRINISGGMSFHYDESLKGDPRQGRFLAASWKEL